MGSDRPRSPEKLDRKPANEREITPSDDTKAVSTQNSPVFRGVLSNLPADTPIKQLAGAIKARWVCEQAHQQLKEELGLDHFEGRSWQGLHRHCLMCMIALAFLQSRRLKQAKGEKKNLRTSATTQPASSAPSHP